MTPVNYPNHASTILQLAARDQELRNHLAETGELFEGYNPQMERLHLSNSDTLAEIMEEIAYPTIENVGKEASEAAWLVIQHAISNPAFMRRAEALLQDAVRLGQANPVNLAYLSDRIAVLSGEPQRYGTQFDWDENGELSPNPYDDLHQVNERRKSIGLHTLDEQIMVMRKQAFQERHVAPQNVVERAQELERWKRKVGWLTP